MQKYEYEPPAALDVNGDGQIDIEDVILMAFKVPGVSINRENFLRKELSTRYSQDVIEQAVLTTPMKANIVQNDIEMIATAIIQNKRIKVSGISAALGTPGGRWSSWRRTHVCNF